MGVHPPCKVGQLVDHVSHLLHRVRLYPKAVHHCSNILELFWVVHRGDICGCTVDLGIPVHPIGDPHNEHSPVLLPSQVVQLGDRVLLLIVGHLDDRHYLAAA